MGFLCIFCCQIFAFGAFIGGKPGALFIEAAASAALEAEAKLREDPLYAIRKKEEEQRRALLNNPIRLKMLQDEVRNLFLVLLISLTEVFQFQLEKKRKQEEKKSKKKSADSDLITKMLKLKSKYGTDLKDLLHDDKGFKMHDGRHYSRKRSRSRSDSPKSSRKPDPKTLTCF